MGIQWTGGTASRVKTCGGLYFLYSFFQHDYGQKLNLNYNTISCLAGWSMQSLFCFRVRSIVLVPPLAIGLS